MLRSHGLEPRHRVLLVGPPGNGKTSLAEAIAEALLVPLLVVRYEEVIGSYLGETASRLAAVFAYARMRRCVLFFDEFDAVAKERGDEHETGEIKRVVSSLLMQVDGLPSHAVVVAASNHPELLDRAAHRRFELRLELPLPGRVARIAWFERFLGELGEPVGLGAETLARRTTGASFSQLQDLADDVRASAGARAGDLAAATGARPVAALAGGECVGGACLSFRRCRLARRSSGVAGLVHRRGQRCRGRDPNVSSIGSVPRLPG